MPLLTEFFLGATGHQRPNFDSFIYIHYAAPLYSAGISVIYLLPFWKIWLSTVCNVQRLATKQNALYRLSVSSFVENIFAVKSRRRRKTEQMYVVFWPHFSGGTTPTFLRQIVIARFTVHHLAKFH